MNSKFNKRFLAIAALLPLLGYSQEAKIDSIQEVVVHANRLQIPFSKDNRNVEILSAEQIKQLPVKNLNEVLGLLNGVNLRQRGAVGMQEDVSVGGDSLDQTCGLVKGVEVPDTQNTDERLNQRLPEESMAGREILPGAAARIPGVHALPAAMRITT